MSGLLNEEFLGTKVFYLYSLRSLQSKGYVNLGIDGIAQRKTSARIPIGKIVT